MSGGKFSDKFTDNEAIERWKAPGGSASAQTPCYTPAMKRTDSEFKRRFIERVMTHKVGNRYYSHAEANNAYYDYLESVGETSDGTPEDDADYMVRNGGV